MPKHVGIAACSAEGAALCYRTLFTEAAALMGEHMDPEVSIRTPPLADYIIHLRADNWQEVGKLMLSSVRNLSSIGAQFAICPDNTIHQAFDLVVPQSPIPWLHIAEVVAEEAKSKGWGSLGILGTNFLMIGSLSKNHDSLANYHFSFSARLRFNCVCLAK